jgi:6-phosphogluconolactonase
MSATVALRQVADEAAVARATAEVIARAAEDAIAARGAFTIALTGGSTPRQLYALLADPDAPFRAAIAWDRVHAFFGDERNVPPDHPDSNYGMAHESLLRHVTLASTHRMQGELDAELAARGYEAGLEEFFGVSVERDPPPRFDLVLLGLGTDAHVASLFPGSAALEERRRWVVAPFAEHLGAHRITLTLPVLNRGRQVVFLVSGERKADAVRRALHPDPGDTPPAARVRPGDAALLWIVDDAAAARLPRAT